MCEQISFLVMHELIFELGEYLENSCRADTYFHKKKPDMGIFISNIDKICTFGACQIVGDVFRKLSRDHHGLILGDHRFQSGDRRSGVYFGFCRRIYHWVFGDFSLWCVEFMCNHNLQFMLLLLKRGSREAIPAREKERWNIFLSRTEHV